MFGKAGVLRASFHPRFEGRQHPVRPHRWFRPRPPGADISALFSPGFPGHWRRFFFHPCVLSESIFLRPFAPRPLRRFNATMGALTPARCGSSGTRPEHRAQPGQVSPLHAFRLPTIPPPTTPWTPRIALTPYPSACAACSGLRHSVAGSPVHHAESSSSSCGLAVRLPLLPTPHRCGAVTVGYRPEKVYLEGTRTPPTKCARGRTTASVPLALSSARPVRGARGSRVGLGCGRRRRRRRPWRRRRSWRWRRRGRRRCG